MPERCSPWRKVFYMLVVAIKDKAKEKIAGVIEKRGDRYLFQPQFVNLVPWLKLCNSVRTKRKSQLLFRKDSFGQWIRPKTFHCTPNNKLS